MPLSPEILKQLLNSFRAELVDHVRSMTDGLLALEQRNVSGDERQATLEEVFRAAHSLKGAARAVGVTLIEQLAHSLEDILEVIQDEKVELTSALFTVCYHALDAIQMVQAAHDLGESAPPLQALQSLADMETFRSEHQMQQANEGQAGLDNNDTYYDGQEMTDEVLASDHSNEHAEEVIELKHNTAPPEAASPMSTVQLAGNETIRVSASKLDSLSDQLSELLITKIRVEQRLGQMRGAQEFVGQWQKEWQSIRGAYSRVMHKMQQVSMKDRDESELLNEDKNNMLHASRKDSSQLFDFVDSSGEQLRDLSVQLNNLTREYANDMTHMSLVIDALEQEVKQIRMMPLSTITGSFGRMVRDLAYESDKEAALKIIGGDTELDKRVLEKIKDPLLHLLRNAVNHGVESPARRMESGKPRVGKITLTAEQLGKDVVLSVTDDGSGLDIEAIRRAVTIRNGEDAQTLSESELADTIFSSGLSTSSRVTAVSGRGVGLDVVRRNVQALNGHVNVSWVAGERTTFKLVLPLTLTRSHGLLVSVSDELFAIPLNAVDRILEKSPDEISSLEGHSTIRYEGRPYTLVRLNTVLDLPQTKVRQEGEKIIVLILAAAESRMAFVVDDLVGEQEIVVKGLGNQLPRVKGIAGATVMGSGDVMLILNVADLIEMAKTSKHSSVLDVTTDDTLPAAQSALQRRILIVDDSITTRTLEKNILEAAGYTVELATDGEEALSAIASGGVPDLIVTDIVMPRMNGFDLTRQIKADVRTADVPIILVSSLDSAEQKARGIEVGADAYIVKSGFDQNDLLDHIEQLI